MSDIYFTEDGDLALSSDGDIAMVDTAWRNHSQQAYVRLRTAIGDYLLYPTMGADLERLIGMAQSEATGELGKSLISQALVRDSVLGAFPIDIKAVPVSYQCQPTDTMVTKVVKQGGRWNKSVWEDTPIQDLNVGDKVVTLKSKYGMVINGREITAINIQDYRGDLVRVKAAGKESRYAPFHQCIAVLGNKLEEGNEVVYMMRKGNQYRIGRTVWRNNKTKARHGFLYRSNSQQAEATWILSVHKTEEDAATAEAFSQVKYGIPSTSFVESHNDRFKMDLVKFWELVGDNTQRATECLSDHGLMVDYPLWSLENREAVGSGWSTKVRTAAINLRSGMMAYVPDDSEGSLNSIGFEKDSGIPWSSWRIIEVDKTYYEGKIYSLKVDKDENYIADGILTHNSIRFDIYITVGNRTELALSILQDLGSEDAIGELER